MALTGDRRIMENLILILGCICFFHLGEVFGLLFQQWKADRETKKVKSLWRQEFDEFLKRDLKR